MKRILFIAIAITSITVINAQDNETNSDKEFSILIGPTYGNILSANLQNDKFAETRGTVSGNFGFNFCKYLNKNFGIVFGLEFSGYKNITNYKGAFWATNTTVDRDKYIYYPVVEANYTVTRKVIAGEVPIQIRLKAPINKQCAFFLDAGFKLNFIASAKKVEEGTLKNKGAYPNPNYDNVFILIEDDPYYGFKNYTYNTITDMQPSRVGFSYILGFGIKVDMSEKSFFVFNPTYMRSLTDLTSKSNTVEYANVFGEKSAYTKLTITQFALRLGVGFYLD